MKKFFLYMTAALMMAACSSEGDMLTPTVEDKDMVPEEPLTGVRASVPDVLMYGDEDLTRTSLTYSLAEKRMKFTWETGDNIGVFPTTSNTAQQVEFSLTNEELIVGANSVTGMFEPADENVEPLEVNTHYASYSPYLSYQNANSKFNVSDPFGYNNVPVSYEGQRQAVNVNIQKFYDRNNSTESMDAYKASEIPACEHLGDYDYLVSDATTTELGGVHFNYSRLGGVVRFYFLVPAAEVFDELQLVNSEANFMLEGTMDVMSNTLTATKTGHMLKLKLGPDSKTSGDSFDMTKVDGNPVCAASYKLDKSNAYIIAYMMAAPIELASLKACTLYLVGHKSSTDATKTYYKATLNKYDIPQDRVLQWTSTTLAPDDPITFSPITVQEWEAGTTFTNGDGNGTGGF